MMYGLAILASIIFLMPALLYLCRVIKDPFHPLVFFGTLAFLLTSGGILANTGRVTAVISESTVNTYLVVSMLSMLGFYAGWGWHRRRAERSIAVEEAPAVYDSSHLFMWAVFFDFVGVGIYFYTRGDFTVTGYLREFAALWIVGAILSIQALLTSPASVVPSLVTLAVALIPPIDRFFVYGQRGDTFRAAIIFLPIFFFKKFRPPMGVFVPAALALALVMGMLDLTRTLMGSGEANGRVDALFKAVPSLFEKDETAKASGAETYVFGPAMVQTVRDQQSYEYGAWLYNIGVRFLPKEWFDKDKYFTRWNVTNFIDNTSQDIMFSIPGGSAPSGFAHVFVEFGWGAPVFWLLLGYFVRSRYSRAVGSFDLRQHGYMTALFIVGLYLMSQDLYAATMNTIYLFPAMSIAYHYSRAQEAVQPAAGVALSA